MLSILIKPVSGKCNLKCEYCFYEKTKDMRKEVNENMTEETLENIVKKAFGYANKTVTFAFQGGEPTLIGLPFFGKFISLKEKYNKNNINVNLTIQTNGFNLDEEWVKFFKKEGFLVGLSIDGPKKYHNANRLTFEERGTFDVVIKAKKLMDKHMVAYNVLTVVNSRNYSRAAEIYSFYKKNKIAFVQFIPCLDSGFTQTGKDNYSLKPQMYEMFLLEFFELWYRDYQKGSAISVRLFENVCAIMLGMTPESCELMGKCSIQNVIEADGSIYPCDFYVTKENDLGNINEIEFKDIPKNNVALEFSKMTEPLHKCKKCKYGALCKGGCKRYKSTETGEYYYCSTFKNFYDETIDKFIIICKNIVSRERGKK
ncbi:MAG: anaerobic sulfatase maturase [Sarcina sp.]